MSITYTVDTILHKKNRLSILLSIILLIIMLFALFYKLNQWPTIWWDEGWTLSAARNWIEHGYLGNYLNGQQVPPRIPVRFPVAVPVALSMKIFGIGIWQGRLPGIVFTLLMLSLYVYIISKIYTFRVGVAALLMTIFLSPYVFNPIISGRQVMAEMPMMFYLLGGYTLLWLTITRNKLWGIGAAILFGIAFHAKLQVPPFWFASMGCVILIAALHHHRSLVRTLLLIIGGSLASAIAVYLIQNMIMPGSFSDPKLLNLLLNTSIISLTGSIRWRAVYITAVFALPEVLGYIIAGRQILSLRYRPLAEDNDRSKDNEINKEILRAAIWGLGASWLIWYVTLSSYWIRYLFPAYFIGMIFVAAFVGQLTNDYDIRMVFQQTAAILFRRQFRRSNLITLLLILSFSASFGIAIGTQKIAFSPSPWQPEIAAQYLQVNISNNAKIETFESELLFLVPDLQYHVPPDLVSMQLYRRADIDRQYPINYDPLQGKPDYLIVGPFAQTYGLYSDELINNWFELDADVGGYQFYHRIKCNQYGDY